MVSLTAIESKLQLAFPGDQFAAVAINDAKKGEQIVLFTTMKKPDRKAIANGIKAQGGTDLMVPKTLVALLEMPLLGSGKTDYVTLTRMAKDGAKE
jgi:acyl-[acyl-carrier-protein]-phospholipid O-acyltransferase / long-chain-fatty-acid--[acyl-carrier-protein] ligase